MEKKTNDTYRARLNAHGYEQRDQEHYDTSFIASPVVSDIIIHIMLMLIAGWYGHIVGCTKAMVGTMKKMKKYFEYEDLGEITEHVEYKIKSNYSDGVYEFLKLTQPVMIQNFKDGFDLSSGEVPVTPAEPEQI
eukprot:4404616-Ditylum_brightwellii.AAC.1